MRTSTVFLSIIALCIYALPAHAQQKAESSVDEKESIIHVTMQSEIPNRSAVLKLPLSLIQRLNDQPPLSKLDVQTSQKETHLSARFTFDGMESFKQWYKSDTMQEIIHSLNEKQNRTKLAVEMVTKPHSDE